MLRVCSACAPSVLHAHLWSELADNFQTAMKPAKIQITQGALPKWFTVFLCGFGILGLCFNCTVYGRYGPKPVQKCPDWLTSGHK